MNNPHWTTTCYCD